jgi:type IV secretory pathway VirB9-like protein
VTKTNPEIAIIKKRKERAAATPTGRGREHKIAKNYKEVDTTEDDDAIYVVGVRQTIKVYDHEIAGLVSDESHTTLENKGNYVVIKEACRVLSRPDMPFKAVFGKLNIC